MSRARSIRAQDEVWRRVEWAAALKGTNVNHWVVRLIDEEARAVLAEHAENEAKRLERELVKEAMYGG